MPSTRATAWPSAFRRARLASGIIVEEPTDANYIHAEGLRSAEMAAMDATIKALAMEEVAICVHRPSIV